ncbi:MAG: hypothetical protein JWP35_2473 [Caulobacter sp.]|nr:hypothetical protein [Caulobacter sp.]
MADLAEHKAQVLRSVVEAAPDKVVRNLELALAADPGGSLGAVRAMVEAESRERLMRNIVLAPVAPLCVGAFSDGRQAFPVSVLTSLWRGLKALDAERVREAMLACRPWENGEGSADLLDGLCAIAAEHVRARDPAPFAAAAEACDAAQPDGAARLAASLDLAPIARRALVKLPDWISRMTDERKAAVRLAYRDACLVADDAGPRFFDMLAAHLAEPWLILRIISAAMDRPSERYVASSEMAGFAERAMTDVERRLNTVRVFDTTGGPPAGQTAGQTVLIVAEAIAEMEDAFELNKEAPWGKRVCEQKQSLAAVVEKRLKEIDGLTNMAVPTVSVRTTGRLFKTLPKLTDEPSPPAIEKVLSLLAFAEEIRPAAGRAGFGAVRTKVLEKLHARLDDYVEELLDLLRHGEAEDPERVQAFLGVAADIYAMAKDEKAGQIVRRRAAAA